MPKIWDDFSLEPESTSVPSTTDINSPDDRSWSDFELPSRQEEPLKERGLLGDIGSNIARGVPSALRMAGQGLQVADADAYDNDGFLDDIGGWMVRKSESMADADYLKPDKSEVEGTQGWFKKGAMEGLQSLAPSLTPAAAFVAGSAVGTPAVGVAAGLATMGEMFFGGTYKERMDDLAKKRPDMPIDERSKLSAIDGGIEAGGELVSDALAAFTGGLLNKGVQKVAGQTVKQLLRTSPKQFVTRFAKGAPVEWGTEAAQAKYQSDIDAVAGTGEAIGFTEAAKKTAIPTLVMFGVMHSGATGLNAVKNRQIIKGINSDNPEERVASFKAVESRIDDPEVRQAWRETAGESISNGEKINIDQKLEDLQPVEKPQPKVIPSDPDTARAELKQEIADSTATLNAGNDEFYKALNNLSAPLEQIVTNRPLNERRAELEQGQSPTLQEQAQAKFDESTGVNIPIETFDNAPADVPVEPENTTPLDTLGIAAKGLSTTGSQPKQETITPEKPFYNFEPPPTEEQSQAPDVPAANQPATDYADPMPAIMAEAKRRGGINISQLGNDYDRATKNQLVKRYPGVFKKDGSLRPDEFADEKGFESLDQFIEQAKVTPTKSITAQQAKEEQDRQWYEAEQMQREEEQAVQGEVDQLVQAAKQGVSWAQDKAIADDARFSEEQKQAIISAQESTNQDAEKHVPNVERVEKVTDKKSVAHGQEINVNPSEAQKEAENYQKAHVKLDGLDISIENPVGSERSGTDATGKKWSQEMKADYGYVKGSIGFDKDHVDVFVKPGYTGGAKKVFIIDQYNEDGSFDEHKVVVGAKGAVEAKRIYNSNYEKGWTGGKDVTEMSMDEFKTWVKSDAPGKGAVAGKENYVKSARASGEKDIPVQQDNDSSWRAGSIHKGNGQEGATVQEKIKVDSGKGAVAIQEKVTNDIQDQNRESDVEDINATNHTKQIQDNVRDADTGTDTAGVQAESGQAEPAVIGEVEGKAGTSGENEGVIYDKKDAEYHGLDQEKRSTLLRIAKESGLKYKIGQKGLTKDKLISDILSEINQGDDPEYKLSVSRNLQLSPTNPANIKQELTDSLGKRRLNRLLRSGKVNIISLNEAGGLLGKNQEDIGDVEGFVKDGKVYLIQGNIEKGNANKAHLHELGSHIKLENKFAGKKWEAIMKSFERYSKLDNETGKAIRAAMDKVPADTKPEHIQSEQLAYYIGDQANSSQPLYKRIIAYIKNALVSLGFNAEMMTPEDLVVIAKSGLGVSGKIKTNNVSNKGLKRSEREKDIKSYRFNDRDNPMSDWGHAMFADDRESVEHYGDNEYTVSYNSDDIGVVHAESDIFKEKLKDALYEFGEDYGLNEYIIDSKEETIDNLIEDSNPDNIVESAGIWDSDLFELIWEKVLEPNGWDIVRTYDGTIVLDEDLIKSATTNTGAFSKDNPDIRYSKAQTAERSIPTRAKQYSQQVLEKQYPKVKDIAEGFTYRILDRLAPAKMVQNRYGKLDDGMDYVSAEEARGKKASAESKKMMTEEVKPILQHLAKNDLEIADLDAYAWAKHTPERNARMKEVNAKHWLNLAKKNLQNKELNEIERLVAQKADRAEYQDILDTAFGTIENTEKQLASDAESLASREWTEKEIEKGTPERLQKIHDTRVKKLDRLKKLKKDWEYKSERFAGQTNEEAESVLNDYAKLRKTRALEKARKMLAVINDRALTALVKSGELAPEQATTIRSAYEFYAPLYREGFEHEGGMATGRATTGPIGKPIKVASGSTRKVVDIFGNSVQNRNKAIVRSHKVITKHKLFNLVEETATPDTWWVEDVPKQAAHDREGNIISVPAMQEPDDGLFVRVDGETKLIRVNRDDKQMMTMLDEIKQNDMGQSAAMNMMGKFTRTLAALNTSLNPAFMLTNFPRDIQTAMVNMAGDQDTDGLQKDVLKNIPRLMKEIYRAETDKASSKLYDDFQKHGGKVGWMNSFENASELAKDLNEEIKLYQEGHYTKKKMRKLKDVVEAANSAVENAVRLSTYEQLVKSGVKKERAAKLASDLTVDFTKHGSWGPTINSLYMFANAGIQGNLRMIKALKSKKVQKIAQGIAASGATMSLLAAVAGGDDDDGIPYYDKIDDTLKDRNMIFMIPGSGGKFIKIPMPYGYSLFWNMGDEAMKAARYALSGREYSPVRGAARITNAAMNTFNPLSSATLLQTVSPTAIDPIAMSAENKTWFGGPLKPTAYDKTTPDSQLYWNSVSEPSKKVAAWLNAATGGSEAREGLIDVSPETLDMLAETYAGGVGKLAKDIFGLPFKVASGNAEIRNVPFARKFVGELSPWATSKEYNRVKDEIKTAEAESRAGVLKKENRKYLRYSGKLKSYEKRLRRLKKERKVLQGRGRSTSSIDQKISKLHKRFTRAVAVGLRK